MDKSENVWHTERAETGRFGSDGAKEARGVAVPLLGEDGGGQLRGRGRAPRGNRQKHLEDKNYMATIFLDLYYTIGKFVAWNRPIKT